MKRGKPFDNEITHNILTIIEKKQLCSIEHIRRTYKKIFGRNISWNTIKEHISILQEQNHVIEEVMEGQRKTRMIRIINNNIITMNINK